MKKVKNLIVGCGLSGMVLAERLASEMKEDVLIIDQRDHIGGNIFDYQDAGITIHKYGPHVFHTNDKNVWDYLSKFTEWHNFMYRVKAVIDGIEVNIPFNLNSLHQVFPRQMAEKLESKLIEKFGFNVKVPILKLREAQDADLEFLAQYVYDKVFLGYTLKQWGVKPEDLDPSVSGRVPVYISKDNRYFQDKYQAIPQNGYTAMAQKIVSNPLITVLLETRYQDIKNKIEAENIFYSGPIDEFFDFKFGALPYRSLDLQFKKFDCEYYQSGPQINSSENYDFTRCVEYKYYLNEKSPQTIVSFEYPVDYRAGENERYYPVPGDANQKVYDLYLAEAAKLDHVYFLGRLGDYKYYNMDQTIARALKLFETFAKEKKAA